MKPGFEFNANSVLFCWKTGWIHIRPFYKDNLLAPNTAPEGRGTAFAIQTILADSCWGTGISPKMTGSLLKGGAETFGQDTNRRISRQRIIRIYLSHQESREHLHATYARNLSHSIPE